MVPSLVGWRLIGENPGGEQKYVEASGGGGYLLLSASACHALCWAHTFSHLVVVRLAELCVIIPVLQIRNPRLGVMGKLPQDHKAG